MAYIPVRLVEQGVDWPAVVQAIGSIAAIIAGFAVLAIQNMHARTQVEARARELATTVGNIGLEAIEIVAQRLEAALRTSKGATLFALRGHRTTEMVQAMREFDLTILPPKLAGQFARVRSGVYAVNARITDIFESEKVDEKRKSRRRARLESAGRVLGETLAEFEKLRTSLDRTLAISVAAPDIGEDVISFIQVASGKTVSEKDAFD